MNGSSRVRSVSSAAGGRGRDRRRASRRPPFVRPRGLRDSVLQSAQLIGGRHTVLRDRATPASTTPASLQESRTHEISSSEHDDGQYGDLHVRFTAVYPPLA